MFGVNFDWKHHRTILLRKCSWSITVNGARDMIIQFFEPKLQNMDVDDILTKHEIRETIQLPHKSFPDYVISQFYSKLIVQFLWDFLKFKTNPRLFIFEGKN